ncbi:MAG: nuclear transport factor 2 family protein [Actinomycetota bacterium]|nr:nuclear transport factor 2 family protein [Actinomycetota bacterium]
MGRRRLALQVMCTGTALLLAAPSPTFQAHAVAAAPVCVSRTAGTPAGPTARDVSQLVEDFVRAYNRGDFSRLDQVFAPEPEFEWYMVQGERVGTAQDRSTLLPYFAQRHLAGDRIRLLSVRVKDEPSWHGGYDFGFELRRWSNDPSAQRRYHGKGAAACTISVWSMGTAR